MVSIRTELSDIAQAPEESSKLYRMLQEAVDNEMQAVGFMPDATEYGMNVSEQREQNGHQPQRSQNDAGISEKQLDLVNRVVRENNANKTEVENIALQMFGGGIRTLNRCRLQLH